MANFIKIQEVVSKVNHGQHRQNMDSLLLCSVCALCTDHYYVILYILCVTLLCHYVYPLHVITMSLCVFSVYHYCVHYVHSVHTISVFIMCILCTLLRVLLCILSIPVLCSFWAYRAYPCLAHYYNPYIFSFHSGNSCLYFINNNRCCCGL